MSDLPELLERNRVFTSGFADGDLLARPRLSALVLTCLDPRVDPARFFGLETGDAAVMRNAGGRVTPGILRDLAVIGFLGANLPGGDVTQPELLIVHHTDCGTALLAEPDAQKVMAERLGIEPDEVEAMAVVDPAESLRVDIERLRDTPGVPDQLVVSGFVYDVTNGLVSQVMAPNPFR